MLSGDDRWASRFLVWVGRQQRHPSAGVAREAPFTVGAKALRLTKRSAVWISCPKGQRSVTTGIECATPPGGHLLYSSASFCARACVIGGRNTRPPPIPPCEVMVHGAVALGAYLGALSWERTLGVPIPKELLFTTAFIASSDGAPYLKTHMMLFTGSQRAGGRETLIHATWLSAPVPIRDLSARSP